MSDPLTNVEIDDVLSSIRRLVSEQPEKAVGGGRGKLVLTPALRVMDTRTNRDDDAPAAGPQAAPDDSTPDDNAFDTNAGQTATGPVPGWTAEASASDTQTLEQRIAELEQAVAASADDWEPDGTEAGAGTLPADMPTVFTATSSANTRPWTGIDQPEDRPEPPRTHMAARQDEGPQTADKVPEAQPEAPRADRLADTDTSMFEGDSDEAVLDEEMLRDMVAEFVREELQGALGERITRNVRKLVRAEIQRALAARDLG